MKPKVRVAAALLMSGALAGCDLAPIYHRPVSETPPAFKEEAGWHTGSGTMTVDNGPWWTRFNDDTLNELETRAQAGNQNLAAAVARYDEARDALAQASAGLFPHISADAGGNRQQDSETPHSARGSQALAGRVAALNTQVNGPGTGTSSSGGRAYNDYKLGIDASYDLDVFGRLRNAIAAAGNAAEASRDDLAALNLNLQAEVAEAYFDIRAQDAEISILEQSLKAYQSLLDLTTQRHAIGIAVQADVDQAQAQLASAQAQLDDVRLKRAQLEHALAVLTGQAPANFSLPAVADFNPVLDPVDAGVPSQLLERRPDIAAAERRVAAADAEIGVARAAWFPDFTLSGTIGFESETLPHIISAPSLFWSVGPQIAQTVFDGGEIAAEIASAKAAYNEAVANYRQTVLSASQEVEDNLAAVRQYNREAADRATASAASSRALDQAIARYRGGIDPYLNVSVQENTTLQARLALTEAQMNSVNAYINLIKAIGGTPAVTESVETMPAPGKNP